MAISRQRELLASARSFAFETTLSGQHELDVMRKAASLGYKINLVFISLGTPAMSIGRISQRVLDGGHDIPATDVVRRFERSMSNLRQALKQSDRAFGLDNASPRARLLISIEDGKLKRATRDLPAWAIPVLSRYCNAEHEPNEE
ncbi:hypothetical protein [Trinickia acidisoli]|uniref:hypothetical protein n=1 Tax=Trinickia acidisoli TaxID=2767482 RepID=UPI001A8C2A93|nr:hypothetical protein [Trinickia acidisoli]